MKFVSNKHDRCSKFGRTHACTRFRSNTDGEDPQRWRMRQCARAHTQEYKKTRRLKLFFSRGMRHKSTLVTHQRQRTAITPKSNTRTDQSPTHTRRISFSPGALVGRHQPPQVERRRERPANPASEPAAAAAAAAARFRRQKCVSTKARGKRLPLQGGERERERGTHATNSFKRLPRSNGISKRNSSPPPPVPAAPLANLRGNVRRHQSVSAAAVAAAAATARADLNAGVKATSSIAQLFFPDVVGGERGLQEQLAVLHERVCPVVACHDADARRKEAKKNDK